MDTPRNRDWPLREIAMGLTALGFGLLVYLIDRPASHALLIPSYGMASGHHPFGVFGQWLPSFLHPFAFSLLTAAALPPTYRYRLASCMAWAGINGLFEWGQHPWASGRIAEALLGTFGSNAVTEALSRFFTQGTFDLFDLAAAALGAAVAALVLLTDHGGGGLHAS